jgi:hypothetical protein
MFLKIAVGPDLEPSEDLSVSPSTWLLLLRCATEAKQSWIPMFSQYFWKYWLVN